MNDWWKDFFDADYIQVWSGFTTPERTASEADGLCKLLELREGSRLLDAPCGYGRLSRPLAERGAVVLGVDQSEVLLKHAEDERGDLRPEQLSYRHHDLRRPLAESGFDAAINIFSSLGYGTEDDDLAILRNLRTALRPGGLLVIDTAHRDLAVLNLLRGGKLCQRLADGTLVIEEPAFDSVAGRVSGTWYWSGPRGNGQKTMSIRLYAVPELVALVERAGLRFRSAHRGCSPEPFKAEAPDMGGRLGILAERAPT